MSTTAFLDDTSTVKYEEPSKCGLTRPLVESTSQKGNHDIIAFLEKPIIYDTGELKAIDAINVNIMKAAVPYSLFTNTLWANKLKAVPYLRGDMVFTLNVNASRFTQGRYMLCFLPSPGTRGESINHAWYNMHAISRTQKTQLPHVEIDLATQTSAQLVVPFTSFQTYYNTSVSQNNITNAGLLFLTPYAPLEAGSGPAAVSYTIWASFKNVEISGTYIQSGMIRVDKKKDPMTAERENEYGPVSGLFNSVSRFSTFIGQVPLLTPYTKPLTWASDILKHTAASFGFSKPLVGSDMMRMSRRINPYGASSNGQNDSCTLANNKNNYVKTNSGVSATTIDEMSIDFIKSQYAYAAMQYWFTTDSVGSTLFNQEVKPTLWATALPNSCFADTPVTFLARQFTLWRGSVSFRFKVVKTEFHSGRLAVSFIPYDQEQVGENPTPTLTETASLYRTIVDLRETTEFEICVPYAVPSLYLPVDRPSGRIVIHVLDKLVAPTTVTSSVTLLVEVAGGPDMEFAVPTSEGYGSVFVPTAIQSGYIKFPCQDYDVGEPTLETSMTSIGEKILSLRQLLKRMEAPIQRVPYTTTAGGAIGIRPFVNYVQSMDLSGVLTQGNTGQDSLTHITSCYAFNTGSVHLHIFPKGANTVDYTISYDSSTLGSLAQDVFYEAGLMMTRRPAFVVNKNVEGYFSVHVPNYNNKVARSTMTSQFTTPSVVWPVTQQAYRKGVNQATVYVARTHRDTDTDTFVFCRTAGEDYNCMMWVSTPTFTMQSPPP